MFAHSDPLLPPYQRLKQEFGGNEVVLAVYAMAALMFGGFVIGYQFDVGAAPVTINALGAYDAGGAGLVTAHDVGIWDSGTTLFRSVTVPAGESPERTATRILASWRQAAEVRAPQSLRGVGSQSRGEL